MRGIEEGDQVSVERKSLSIGARVAYIGAQGGLRLALALSYRVMLKRYRFFFFNPCSAPPPHTKFPIYIYIFIYLTIIFLDFKIVK